MPTPSGKVVQVANLEEGATAIQGEVMYAFFVEHSSDARQSYIDLTIICANEMAAELTLKLVSTMEVRDRRRTSAGLPICSYYFTNKLGQEPRSVELNMKILTSQGNQMLEKFTGMLPTT